MEPQKQWMETYFAKRTVVTTTSAKSNVRNKQRNCSFQEGDIIIIE